MRKHLRQLGGSVLITGSVMAALFGGEFGVVVGLLAFIGGLAAYP